MTSGGELAVCLAHTAGPIHLLLVNRALQFFFFTLSIWLRVDGLTPGITSVTALG